MTNVAIITSPFGPFVCGVSIRLRYIINLLKDRGFSFTIITPTVGIENSPDYKIVNVPGRDIPGWVLKNKCKGVKVADPMYFMSIKNIIRDALNDNKIDIVHVIDPEPMSPLAHAVANELNIPVVQSFHTDIIKYIREGNGYYAVDILSRLCMRHMGINDARKIAAPSKDTLNKIYEYGILTRKPSNCMVIPPFPPLECPEPITKYKRSIVFVGRLSHEKTIDRLIDAARYLSGFTIHIIGDGPCKDELIALANKNKSCDFHFHGMVNHDIIVAYYKLGSIFVQPSGSETQGLTTLEAMICGLVPIVYPEGGTLDMVNDENALFFKTPNELADKIMLLDCDDELYKKLHAGVHDYVTNVSKDNNIVFWENFYSTII